MSFCGLASAGRGLYWGRFRPVLLELGLLLPFVYLGHWGNTGGDEAQGGRAWLVEGEAEKAGAGW
jgi:hypothetical protein